LNGIVGRQLQRRALFNRPNDVICRSNGCLYFTDPANRRTYHEREIPGSEGDNNLWGGACVYRLAPDGGLSVLGHREYPNALAAGRAHNVRGESRSSQ
jgi:sugar lactone lactonase YvrE